VFAARHSSRSLPPLTLRDTYFSPIYAVTQPPQLFWSLVLYTDGLEYRHSKRFATETN